MDMDRALQIAVCDDRPEDMVLLHTGVDAWLANTPGLRGRVQEFASPAALCERLRHGASYDIYILDILMPEMDGISLGRMIRRGDSELPVIYVTSSTEYALDAFGIHAVGYIPKPVNRQELAAALQTAYTLHITRRREVISVRDGIQIAPVALEELLYVENSERKMNYVLSDGRHITNRRRGGSFESAVGPVAENKEFLQPHKSYFINMKYIRSLYSDHIVMDDGKDIPIARGKAPEIRRRYLAFLEEKGGGYGW